MVCFECDSVLSFKPVKQIKINVSRQPVEVVFSNFFDFLALNVFQSVSKWQKSTHHSEVKLESACVDFKWNTDIGEGMANGDWFRGRWRTLYHQELSPVLKRCKGCRTSELLTSTFKLLGWQPALSNTTSNWWHVWSKWHQSRPLKRPNNYAYFMCIDVDWETACKSPKTFTLRTQSLHSLHFTVFLLHELCYVLIGDLIVWMTRVYC